MSSIALTKYQGLMQFGEVRFITVVAGRRWGKTELCIYFAKKYSFVATRVLYVAPNSRAFKHIRGDLRVEFIQQVTPRCTIDQFHPRTKLVILDEAELIPREFWDKHVFPFIQEKNCNALIVGTPAMDDKSAKKPSWFRQCFNQGLDQFKFPEWMSFQFPTWFNPYVSVEDLREAKESISPEAWQTQFEARFLGSEFDE